MVEQEAQDLLYIHEFILWSEHIFHTILYSLDKTKNLKIVFKLTETNGTTTINLVVNKNIVRQKVSQV